MIRSKGLAKGATIENTLVFDDMGVKNPDGMRWHDEPIRHKLVDAIGDLSLAGHRIAGRFVGHRSGHALNQALIRNLMNDHSSWKFESCDIAA
jgi:UDP-3-O-[3-hydroxymyristoyl] N-acetylglucosamine deacetylase